MSDQAAIDLRYLGAVLEAYFAWRHDGNQLGYAPFARVIGMPQPVENRRVLDLSDDEFTIVDQAFAALEQGDRDLIEVEYTRQCHPKDKAAACRYGGRNVGAAIAHYRRDLHDAERRLYFALETHLDEWERAKPMRRKA